MGHGRTKLSAGEIKPIEIEIQLIQVDPIGRDYRVGLFLWNCSTAELQKMSSSGFEIFETQMKKLRDS